MSSLQPPENLTVSQWSDRNGYVIGVTGRVMKWRTREPQRAILDAFNIDQITEISCFKPARFGWTSIIQMAMSYFIAQEPSDQLLVQPRDKDVKEWSKEAIQPIIDETPALKKLVAKQRPGSSGNTYDHKTYPGGVIRMRASNSPDGFRRYSARVAMLDEIDGYPMAVGPDGDLVGLVYSRVQDYWNHVVAMGSTPTEEDISRIAKAIANSSLGHPFLACPHCGDLHIRKFRKPAKPILIRGEEQNVSFLHWPKGKPEKAVYVCQSCGGEIGQKYHNNMLKNCFWKGEHWSYENQEFQFLPGFHGRIGFHPWAGYVVSPNTTPAKIAQRFVKDKGNRETLKVFVNTVLAETWEVQGDKVEADILFDRREDFSEECPDGVLFLSMGVDIQKDRIEFEVVGWGYGEESWSVDYQILPGDVLQDEVWDDLEECVSRRYKHEIYSDMSISTIGIDHGYESTRVNAFVKKMKMVHLYACKGISGVRPVVEPLNKRMRRLQKSKKTKAKPQLIGVDQAKDTLYTRLHSDKTSGPGICHFPKDRDKEYFEQIASEKKRTVYRDGRPVYEWFQLRPRNEALDCRNYAYASMLLYGVNFDQLYDDLSKKDESKSIKDLYKIL